MTCVLVAFRTTAFARAPGEWGEPNVLGVARRDVNGGSNSCGKPNDLRYGDAPPRIQLAVRVACGALPG